MQTDEKLIDAVRAGDHSAFAELVRRYERAAAATAWRILWDHHAVQDVTQNTFVEVFRQLGKLRNPARFGAWVMQIARREALRIARRTCRTEPLEANDETGEFVEANLLQDHLAELLAAIGGLPEQERIVVGMRYLDGHSVTEIARLTGRPVGTVTKQLSRAVERLKSILKEVST